MKIDILYYGSAVLCVLSFALFAFQVIMHVLRTRQRLPTCSKCRKGLAPRNNKLSI